MTKKCALCGCDSEYIFDLNGYKIYQCRGCKTAFAGDMPSSETLAEFYKGFKYCINEDNKSLILDKMFKKFFAAFKLSENAKMLDIGGGSGYFSLAFEKFGFGEATYIDLDSEACNYVKTLGITSVINDDVKNLSSDNKFDFIYSRHVIEHLPDPLVLIDKSIDLLSENGVFLLQLPNGLSYERLLDWNNYEARRKLLKSSNNFSEREIDKILFSKKTAFDLNPPRHLWAFSQKGLKAYLDKRDDIRYKIYTKSIADKTFSPFMNYGQFRNYPFSLFLKVIKTILRSLISIPHGKAHLVVEIRRR